MTKFPERCAVITGIGAITPFGDLDQTCAAIESGRTAVAAVQSFDASSFASGRAGEVMGFDARPWFRVPKALKLTDRRTRFVVAAAGQAVLDAALPGTGRDDLAVLVGTSGSDVQTEELGRALGRDGDPNDVEWFSSRILRRLNPLWLLVNLANMASAHVAIQLEARGPNSTITTGWIAGLQAIREAAQWIASGDADVVVAGGGDTGVLPFAFASYEADGLLQAGFVPGEGAAMFVLEERDYAERRGATILAAIGEGTRTDGLACDESTFEPQLGHALAAATPIALAVTLRRERDSGGSRTICATARGAEGQATALALTVEGLRGRASAPEDGTGRQEGHSIGH